MVRDNNIKRKNKNSYEGYGDKIYGSHKTSKGSSNVNPYGGVNNRRNLKGCIGGNSCTDPKSAVAEYSTRIGEDYFFINQYGIFKKGILKVKKEGRGKNRKDYVALNKRLGARANWNGNPRATTLENYIVSQVSSCIKRGDGHFYTPNLNYINYNIVLEIAEKDKEAAKCLAGLYNGSISEKNIETLTGKIKEVIKEKQISQQ